MDNRTSLQQIRDFCQTERKSSIIEAMLYYKYTTDLDQLIESYKRDHEGRAPQNNLVMGFRAPLLSRNSLLTNANIAEQELEVISRQRIQDSVKKVNRVNFWKSVGASIVASFIFVVLMILVVLVAENQIKSIFNIDNGKQVKTEQIQQNQK